MKHIKLFENNVDFSDFDFKKMISDTLFYTSNPSSPEVLKLIIKCGGKIPIDNPIFGFVNLPGLSAHIKKEMLTVLVNYGEVDINTKMYYNGRLTSTTCLTLQCSYKDKKNNDYNLIKHTIELGGDMRIKDNFGNSGYEYLDERDVMKLITLIPNFKVDYDLYMNANKYNL